MSSFPSPAEDLGAKRIELFAQLITHPAATFFVKARVYGMAEAGISDDDTLIVNRAIKPKHGNIVMAVVDGEPIIRRLYKRSGRIKLQAASVTYPDIQFKEGQQLEVWGVVTYAIKDLRV